MMNWSAAETLESKPCSPYVSDVIAAIDTTSNHDENNVEQLANRSLALSAMSADTLKRLTRARKRFCKNV
jgi:hypothetical protein